MDILTVRFSCTQIDNISLRFTVCGRAFARFRCNPTIGQERIDLIMCKTVKHNASIELRKYVIRPLSLMENPYVQDLWLLRL